MWIEKYLANSCSRSKALLGALAWAVSSVWRVKCAGFEAGPNSRPQQTGRLAGKPGWKVQAGTAAAAVLAQLAAAG